MSKVIGYKVDNSFYYKIKKQYGNVSDFLRKAVAYYLENTVNQVNSITKLKKDSCEHILLRKALDSLPMRYNRFNGEIKKSNEVAEENV